MLHSSSVITLLSHDLLHLQAYLCLYADSLENHIFIYRLGPEVSASLKKFQVCKYPLQIK
jgi:hypothetical protein